MQETETVRSELAPQQPQSTEAAPHLHQLLLKNLDLTRFLGLYELVIEPGSIGPANSRWLDL